MGFRLQLEAKLLYAHGMRRISLRKAKEEFHRAIARQEAVAEKAAAYLSALRRYRIAVARHLAGAGASERAFSPSSIAGGMGSKRAAGRRGNAPA